MRWGPRPEPLLGEWRWVRRFAWIHTEIQPRFMGEVLGTVWLESYWRQQLRWSDGRWYDSPVTDHRNVNDLMFLLDYCGCFEGALDGAGSLNLQHLVSDQPVTNDQPNGFRSRNPVMLGNELVDAREDVGWNAYHDGRRIGFWAAARFFDITYCAFHNC